MDVVCLDERHEDLFEGGFAVLVDEIRFDLADLHGLPGGLGFGDFVVDFELTRGVVASASVLFARFAVVRHDVFGPSVVDDDGFPRAIARVAEKCLEILEAFVFERLGLAFVRPREVPARLEAFVQEQLVLVGLDETDVFVGQELRPEGLFLVEVRVRDLVDVVDVLVDLFDGLKFWSLLDLLVEIATLSFSEALEGLAPRGRVPCERALELVHSVREFPRLVVATLEVFHRVRFLVREGLFEVADPRVRRARLLRCGQSLLGLLELFVLGLLREEVSLGLAGLGLKGSPLEVKAGAKVLNNDGVVMNVTVIPDGDTKWALTLSINHAIADGHTYYQIYNMLSASAEVKSLNATRKESFTADKTEAIGKAEVATSMSVAYGLNCLGSMLLGSAPKCRCRFCKNRGS